MSPVSEDLYQQTLTQEIWLSQTGRAQHDIKYMNVILSANIYYFYEIFDLKSLKYMTFNITKGHC